MTNYFDPTSNMRTGGGGGGGPPCDSPNIRSGGGEGRGGRGLMMRI